MTEHSLNISALLSSVLFRARATNFYRLYFYSYVITVFIAFSSSFFLCFCLFLSYFHPLLNILVSRKNNWRKFFTNKFLSVFGKLLFWFHEFLTWEDWRGFIVNKNGDLRTGDKEYQSCSDNKVKMNVETRTTILHPFSFKTITDQT